MNAALDYASLFPIDAIVMAFNFNDETFSTTLTLLKQLQAKGVMILVAAGNCDPTQNNCNYIQRPAVNNYVYAIGSIDSNNEHSYFSADGPQLDFVLYGDNALTYSPDYLNGTYDSGTSFSVAMAGALFVLYKAVYLQKESVFNFTDFNSSIYRSTMPLGPHDVYGAGLPQIFTAYKALSDTDYPFLQSYTYTFYSASSIAVTFSISDQSGISSCVYQEQSGVNVPFSTNQTCSGIMALPVFSDIANEVQYQFIVSNISSILKLKIFLTDLNFHASEFTIQFTLTLNSQNNGLVTSTATNFSTDQQANNRHANSTSSPDSLIGTIQQSTITSTKTTNGFEVIELIGFFISLLYFKRKRKK